MQIWKYLLTQYENNLEMPEGARLLTVQMQHATPTLWVEVDPTATRTQRKVCMVETGQDVDFTDYPAYQGYVGTYQLGGYVGHVYDLGEYPLPEAAKPKTAAKPKDKLASRKPRKSKPRKPAESKE